MNIKQQLQDLIEQTTNEMGVKLKASVVDVAIYADERAAYLVTIFGQTGYQKALIAERDSIALKAGISAVGDADAFDSRIIGIIQSVLSVGVSALAGI